MHLHMLHSSLVCPHASHAFQHVLTDWSHFPSTLFKFFPLVPCAVLSCGAGHAMLAVLLFRSCKVQNQEYEILAATLFISWFVRRTPSQSAQEQAL